MALAVNPVTSIGTIAHYVRRENPFPEGRERHYQRLVANRKLGRDTYFSATPIKPGFSSNLIGDCPLIEPGTGAPIQEAFYQDSPVVGYSVANTRLLASFKGDIFSGIPNMDLDPNGQPWRLAATGEIDTNKTIHHQHPVTGHSLRERGKPQTSVLEIAKKMEWHKFLSEKEYYEDPLNPGQPDPVRNTYTRRNLLSVKPPKLNVHNQPDKRPYMTYLESLIIPRPEDIEWVGISSEGKPASIQHALEYYDELKQRLDSDPEIQRKRGLGEIEDIEFRLYFPKTGEEQLVSREYLLARLNWKLAEERYSTSQDDAIKKEMDKALTELVQIKQQDDEMFATRYAEQEAARLQAIQAKEAAQVAAFHSQIAHVKEAAQEDVAMAQDQVQLERAKRRAMKQMLAPKAALSPEQVEKAERKAAAKARYQIAHAKNQELEAAIQTCRQGS